MSADKEAVSKEAASKLPAVSDDDICPPKSKSTYVKSVRTESNMGQVGKTDKEKSVDGQENEEAAIPEPDLRKSNEKAEQRSDDKTKTQEKSDARPTEGSAKTCKDAMKVLKVAETAVGKPFVEDEDSEEEKKKKAARKKKRDKKEQKSEKEKKSGKEKKISDREKEDDKTKRKSVMKKKSTLQPRKGGSASDENKKKLEKLKQNMMRVEVSKRSNRSTKKKKSVLCAKKKSDKKESKKSLRERLRNKLDSISNFFTGSNSGLQRSLAKAQKKLSGISAGKCNAGDDTFPVNAAQRKNMDNDEYEECDDNILKDTTHRQDLVLVKNNDNDGKLFVDGKPFWKDKKYNAEILPDSKLLSKLLIEVVNNKRTLMDPADEPLEMDETQTLEDMRARDPIWFKEEHITSNTIRSIVGTIGEDQPPTKKSSERATKKLVVIEPKTMVSYRRHFTNQGTTVPFAKSPAGTELRRLKLKTPTNTSSTSTSSSNSSNSNNAGGSKDGKIVVVKKKTPNGGPLKPERSIRPPKTK